MCSAVDVPCLPSADNTDLCVDDRLFQVSLWEGQNVYHLEYTKSTNGKGSFWNTPGLPMGRACQKLLSDFYET